MTGRDTATTREQAHSRATGALFFVGFGAVWLATGLSQMHRSSIAALMSLGFTVVLLLLAIAHLMRRSRELPPSQTSAEEQVRSDRMFTAVNIIQWVSIGTAVAILNLLHMPEYIVPAISILVGLHLFPLAGSFKHPQHYATGTLLVLWPLGCLALLTKPHVSGVCALGVGVLLLLSAATTLARVFAAMRMVQLRNAVARS